MSKKTKCMPRSKYNSIDNRFLDLRFNLVENALNNYNHKKMSVLGSTSFQIGRGIEDLNNYDPNKTYLGKASLKIKHTYRGKEHFFKVGLQEITKEEACGWIENIN